MNFLRNSSAIIFYTNFVNLHSYSNNLKKYIVKTEVWWKISTPRNKTTVDKKLNFWRHFAYIHIKNSFCTVLFLDSLKVTYLLLNLLIFSYFEYFWSTAVRGTINLTVRTGNLKLTFVVNFSHNSSAIICYAYFVKLHSYNKTLKTIHRSKLKYDEKYQPHVIRPRVDSKSNFWRHFAIIHIKISFLARFYS